MTNKSVSGLSGFLDKLVARSPLNAVERQAILALPHVVRSLRRHEFIVREDEMPRFCGVLVEGFVMRHKTAGNGLRQIFALQMPGDLVDLHNSLLGRADHNLQMLSNGLVTFIPIDAIREISALHPNVG